MRTKQNETEIKMQFELDSIIPKIKNKTFAEYGDYEDEVGALIEEYCLTCQKIIDKTTMGISILMANIRNYVRSKANITFGDCLNN